MSTGLVRNRPRRAPGPRVHRPLDRVCHEHDNRGQRGVGFQLTADGDPSRPASRHRAAADGRAPRAAPSTSSPDATPCASYPAFSRRRNTTSRSSSSSSATRIDPSSGPALSPTLSGVVAAISSANAARSASTIERAVAHRRCRTAARLRPARARRRGCWTFWKPTIPARPASSCASVRSDVEGSNYCPDQTPIDEARRGVTAKGKLGTGTAFGPGRLPDRAGPPTVCFGWGTFILER